MLQWIKYFPIKPAYLGLLLTVLYCLVHFPGPVPFLLLVFFLARLFLGKSRAVSIKISVILLFFAVYFGMQKYLIQQADRTAPNQISHIQVVPDTISVNGDSLSFRGKSDGRLYQAFYRLRSEKEQAYFRELSQTVELDIEAELTEADQQRNFGGFDYRRYLETQGIYKQVSISAVKAVHPLVSYDLFDRLTEWRRAALVYIKSAFPQPMSHYMTGLLFGYLDKDFSEMSDLYSSLGIIHLFALSGMQVSFFIDKFRWIFLRLGFRQEEVNALQFPFSLIYAGLTGFSPSVVRSLLQKNFSSQGISGLDNLALTVLISFFLIPHFLLTASGVLSFAYAFILSLLSFENLRKIKRFFAESAAVALGILPLISSYFASFQPLSVLLTWGFSAVFDLLFLPLLCLAFLLSPFWKIAELNGLFLSLEALVRWVGSWLQGPLVLGQPTVWVLTALLILLGLTYDFRHHKKVLLMLTFSLGLLFFLTKNPQVNEITVVDVGQGDSIFLRDIQGRTVLIDVGGKVNFGSKEKWQKRQIDSNASHTLLPYLRSRGVGTIDTLVLSHTDSDHIADVLEVVDTVKVRQIWVSPGSLRVPDFVRTLEKTKVPIHVTAAGDRLPIFDSRLEVLYPITVGDGGNNDSIVLYGKFLGTRFLFTGDLEASGEKAVIKAYPKLRADVLKAGHHGSRGSSSPAFIQLVQPQTALISAGKNNRYGHPHQETLARFKKFGTAVYRTDQQGAIRFSGWRSWQLETVR